MQKRDRDTKYRQRYKRQTERKRASEEARKREIENERTRERENERTRESDQKLENRMREKEKERKRETRNRQEIDGCSTVVLMCFTCPAMTVGTVVLRALVRVRERALGCFARSPKSPPARRHETKAREREREREN